MVYGEAPPTGAAVADPLFPPKQETFVLEVMLAEIPPVLPTTATAVTVQPPLKLQLQYKILLQVRKQLHQFTRRSP